MPTRAPGPSDPVAVEVTPGTWFVPGWVNVAAFATADGLVLVDAGLAGDARRIHTAVRSVTDLPLHTVVFTHGHVDHAFGLRAFLEAGDRPRIVAHVGVAERFRRYARTAGYNAGINAVQFGIPPEAVRWPRTDADFAWPDVTYTDALDLEIGGETFCLRHARGETDDGTWVWVPGRKVLACGDLFIGVAPNAGNPQKVQRYPRDWARGLRAMAACDAEILLPGHGLPITGAARVRAALTESAELLEHLYDETLAMMNAGARLDEIIHTVRAPEHLLARPYLRPIYDEPEFIVHNIWRLLGGWYDGNPATLKPAPDAAVAAEVAALAGGPGKLARRAVELAEAGDLRLAGHLAEWAALAAPEDAAVHGARAEVFERRRAAESSTMARGVFGAAARESREATGEAPERR